MKAQVTCLAVAASLLPGLVQSMGAELGDPAAPLSISEWVKGEAVDLRSIRGKKVVVVEFWATWCGPCLRSIPHLTEVQHKFADRGVVVVGVSTEDSATVRPFVEKMGEKMDYTVALDSGGQTSQGYMTAYGQNGIPHAFIVDLQGNIAWQGHPMAGLDQALDRIAPAVMVENPSDKKRAEAQRKLREFTEMAMRGEDSAKLDQLANELIALNKELGGIEPGKPLNLAELRRTVRFQSLMRDYQRAVAARKPESELAKIEAQATPLAPEGFRFEDYRGNFSLQRTFQDYYRAVSRQDDPAKIAALTQRLELIDSSDAAAMNEIAWTLLTDEKIKTRNLRLALKFAQAAVEVTKGQNADLIDTYARALFENGKAAEAVQQQERAIALTSDQGLQSTMKANLKRYQVQASSK